MCSDFSLNTIHLHDVCMIVTFRRLNTNPGMTIMVANPVCRQPNRDFFFVSVPASENLVSEKGYAVPSRVLHTLYTILL